MRSPSMHQRLSLLAFIIYVALDLSNPFIPGAFNFNPETCVEATQHQSQRHERSEATAQTQPEGLRQPVERAERVVRRRAVTHHRVEWRAPARVAHPAALPPAPSDDH